MQRTMNWTEANKSGTKVKIKSLDTVQNCTKFEKHGRGMGEISIRQLHEDIKRGLQAN